MEPEAPKPEKPRKDTEKKPTVTLTERQRREARQRRRSRRRGPARGNPLTRGLKATWFEIKRTLLFLGNGILTGLAALGPVFSSVGMGLVWLLEKAGKGLTALGRVWRRALATAGRIAVALDRVATPHRALVLVAGIAAVILGVAQFKGLGTIEIGQAGYDGIEDLVRAPTTSNTTPAGSHTRIFVPIAAVALLAVVVIGLGGATATAARFSRWRRLAAMTLTMIGLLTLVVTLLIDLPNATDTAEVALAYEGVSARLLSGFWLELTAGAALAVAGLALVLEPATRRLPDRRRERHPSAVAGSRA